MNKTALIVDDDRSERRMIVAALRNTTNLNFKEAENGKEALHILNKHEIGNIALVILDLDMPVMGGIETLESIRKNHPAIPVIILTGQAVTETAVKAMKMGAIDFLCKPVEGARLDVSVRNSLKMSLMSQEISRLKRRTEDVLQFSDLIGHDKGLADTIKIGQKAAACDLPVLITGETGTGKEMFASAIHGEGKRAGRPFVAVNCGALPEKLVESILFGHEKGAFTGAINKTLGKFQEASGGTIFLDEIGELPLDAQVKLLRVLQQQTVEPVGANKAVPINVRLISATNRNLSEEVKEGRFREDLYFRLNVLHINLPPLRARKNDIPAMVECFIEQFCAAHQVLPKSLSQDAMNKLQSHPWQGNVRELENVINRSMALCDNTKLEEADFSFVKTNVDSAAQMRDGTIIPIHEDGTFKSHRELEHEIIQLALTHHGGNISKTARVLGIAKSTLYSKLERFADKKSI